MPYLAFDLDALAVAPDVARLACRSEESIVCGMVRMWAFCFKSKVEVITAQQLGGFYGPCDDRLPAALAAFGFLATCEGGFRVKGADRYKRILEAQQRAAAASNDARRAARDSKSVDRQSSDGGASVDRQSSDGGGAQNDGLTPNTEHRDPNTEKEGGSSATPTPPPAPKSKTEASPDEAAVWDHWRMVMKHPKAILDQKRLKKIRAAVTSHGVDTCKAAIDGCARSAWHMGQNEDKKRYDGILVILRDAEQIEKFAAQPAVAADPRNSISESFKGLPTGRIEL